MPRLTIRTSYAAHVIALLFLIACSGVPHPRKLYPEFRPERVRPLVMLMDIGLLHDVAGDMDEVRIYEAHSVADSLAVQFRAWLAPKNYRIHRSVLTSMGLPWPSTWEFLTLTSPAQETLPPAEKPKKHPPFFTNDSLSRDVMTLTTVASIYSEVRSARAQNVAKKPRRLVESAPVVLRYLDAAKESDILVVFVSGRDISKGKRAGGIFLALLAIAATAAGSPTVAPAWDYGGVMLDAYIVDGQTGELLWSDSRLAEGAPANWPTVSALAARVIAELP